jgi:hypothetical protein
MAKQMIPSNFLLRSSNPGAEINSPFKGLPEWFKADCHRLNEGGLVNAVKAAYYQNAEMAFGDAPKHPEIYLGDRLFLTVNIDEFGNPGVQTWPEYAIRQGSTVRALLTANGYPRHQAAPPCHITEECIMDIYLGAIEQGVPFSWTVVRPKFGKSRAGDILFFWPSHMPAYGAAAADKLGTCVDLKVYTSKRPLEPKVIHVAMPWLSEQEFHGVHAIAVGSGRKRLLVVNGGPYDGGTKKPITFQFNDRELPRNSLFTVQHWAITKLTSGRSISIGNTTAAGKSEGSSDEGALKTPGLITWSGESWKASARVSRKLVEGKIPGRQIVSDDITAVTVDFNGRPVGVELEPVHFYRTDLYTNDEPIKFIQDCAEGRVSGRIYWYNTGYNATTHRFEPHRHEMLNTENKCTNPRCSYPVTSIEMEDLIHTSPDKPASVDYLMVSIPAPAIQTGWHMPTILRLTTKEFFAQCLHGARANKGNPALGAVGQGNWAFEGFVGKSGFSLDTEAEMLSRDLKFWQSLNRETPCFMVFNGYSMGGKQEFKYSGTFLLRYLLENWHEQMLNAPLIDIPGVYTGGVPDLRTFLPADEQIDERLWNPELLDSDALCRDALEFDHFAYLAANQILGQTGLSEEAKLILGDLMREFTTRRRELCC